MENNVNVSDYKSYDFVNIDPATIISSKFVLINLIEQSIASKNFTESEKQTQIFPKGEALFVDGFNMKMLQINTLYQERFLNATKNITQLDDILDLFIAIMKKNDSLQYIVESQLKQIDLLIKKNNELVKKLSENILENFNDYSEITLKQRIENKKRLLLELKMHQNSVKSKLSLIACLNMLKPE